MQWAARVFQAIRGRDDRTGREMWAGWDGVGAIPIDLGGEPDLWQPLHPEKWMLALPSPVVWAGPGRMVSERTKFQAVEDAASADLAAEMERDRADARARPSDEASGAVVASQWWRDVSQIRYAAFGQITQRHAEGRVMRAVAWAGVGGGLTLASRTTATVMAELADAAALAADDDGRDLIVRFEPLPVDQSDFLVAMAWFTALNPPESRRGASAKPWGLSSAQRVLAARARSVPLSFGDIGRFMGWRGHQRAQQVYGETMERIWKIANGAVVRRGRVDQIEALRERNRAYRREEAR